MKEVFGDKNEFGSLRDVFDIKTRYDSHRGQRYRKYIEETLHRLVKVEGKTFGGLIMEPVILGAGGMLFAQVAFFYAVALVSLADHKQRSPVPTLPRASRPPKLSNLRLSLHILVRSPCLDRSTHHIRRSLHRHLPSRPLQLFLLPPNTPRYLMPRQAAHRRSRPSLRHGRE